MRSGGGRAHGARRGRRLQQQHQAPLRTGFQESFSDLTVSGSTSPASSPPLPRLLDIRLFTKVCVGGAGSLYRAAANGFRGS